MQQPNYKTWADKGGNIGIECLVCHLTHWTGKEPCINPRTKEPCNNCIIIRETGILQTEQELHQNHGDLPCTHEPSQP